MSEPGKPDLSPAAPVAVPVSEAPAPAIPEPARPDDLVTAPGEVLYPHMYTWMVFLGTLDILMTWVVLAFGGAEVNKVAATVLERWGLSGMIVLKFASVVTVVLISEFVGRRRHGTGRFLALAAVIGSLAPVMLAFALLVRFVFGPEAALNFEELLAE